MIETTTVLTLWVHISCVPITYPWQTLNVPEPHALLHMGGGADMQLDVHDVLHAVSLLLAFYVAQMICDR